jgi:hypothetical protein
MKKAKPLLAMAYSRPRREGRSTCCTMLGSEAATTAAMHSRISTCCGSRDFHLTSSEVAHLRWQAAGAAGGQPRARGLTLGEHPQLKQACMPTVSNQPACGSWRPPPRWPFPPPSSQQPAARSS